MTSVGRKMTNGRVPRAFLSHSSADKERFVLGFARKLRENGIEAWVDRWEMLPGDSLAEKVYEEGLGGADAVVAIVSENSIESPWVKDELNTAKVRQITGKCKLIPVILGDVDEGQLPVVLGSTIWESIDDPNDYDLPLRRVVDAIYNRRDRPGLGRPPAYVESLTEAVPGLDKKDSIVLKIMGDLAIEEGDSLLLLNSRPIFARVGDLGLGEEQAKESLEILEEEHLVSLSKVHEGDGLSVHGAMLTGSGFDRYLGTYFDGYGSLVRSVGVELINNAQEQQDADEVADRLGTSVAVVRHVVRRFKERHFVYAIGVNEGNIIVTETRPRLRRWLEETVW